MSLSALQQRTDNLVSEQDLRELALEEVAIYSKALLIVLGGAEHLRHFQPCGSDRAAMDNLKEALRKLQALR
jgi:hypothetical protein